MVLLSIIVLNYISLEKRNDSKTILFHTLIVDSGNNVWTEKVKVTNGTSVFQILNQTFPINYKEYKGLGVFIISINNISQNRTHSWVYFVNGKLPKISADKYFLYTNSTIKWKLVKNDEILKNFED